MKSDFLPISKEDMRRRGWDRLDVILITGDAYVDHPAYGAAVIGRVLEAAGFRVGIIAQPDWRRIDDFTRLGRPRLFFGITSGNVDSMVANYTANKRPRKSDTLSPGGRVGLRPDRSLIVYANRVRQAFKDVSIVIGGIEASMRRLAHYDYWENRVRRSILFDARADILVYGMGERQVVTVARHLEGGLPLDSLGPVPGTGVIRKDTAGLSAFIELPSFEAVADSHEKFNLAFQRYYAEQNPMTAQIVVQAHGDRVAVLYPPPGPLSSIELDAFYEYGYTRRWHPVYEQRGGVPGLETVRHSLITHRGCTGECNFCSLYFHQGRMVQSRSADSIAREVRRLVQDPDFHGTITDMGGPTANLYGADCPRWRKKGFCPDRRCMVPKTCPHLDSGEQKSLDLYRRIRNMEKVKHAFVQSGFRYDLFDTGTDASLEELCRYHVSGQMKVAPEHVSDGVLDAMGKPHRSVYEAFVNRFDRINAKLPSRCYLVNYFISAHPGSTLKDALQLALYLIDHGIHPEQVQDFIPLPMTMSGAMYHTGSHPFTGAPLYVARSFRERKMQRALIQYRNPSSAPLIRKALTALHANHLSGRFAGAAMVTKSKSSEGGKGRRKRGRRDPPPSSLAHRGRRGRGDGKKHGVVEKKYN